MAQIVNRLPFGISGRATPGTASAQLTDVSYDYAIGGQLFLTAISQQHPMLRGMAPIKKDQFDNQREPGEQSLTGWWLRSQSTFVGGAGMTYQDPDLVSNANLQNKHTMQYGSSVGLNPWTANQLSLLRSTTQRISDVSANAGIVLGWNDGTDRYWYAVGNVLKSDTGSATTTITWGGANTIRDLTSDGTSYFAADNVGIYKGTGSGAGALVWNTGSTNVVCQWAKGRLMAGIDNKIYELTTGGPALPAAKFTHLNSSWVWTTIAEGNAAIYAAGYAGNQSAIYKFTLASDGSVPTLSSGGTITSQLPVGETVLSMFTYLGTFVGIGTNRGFRVGEIDGNGDISYGPLLFEVTGGVNAVAGYDRFFFVAASNAIDGGSGLYRVDLSRPIQDNGVSGSVRFAYATDLQAHTTGTVTSVSNFGTTNRMVFAVTGSGSYLESASVLEPTGYFTTGRIRFSTQEPKLFKFLTVRTPSSYMGTLSASVIDPGGSTTSIITISQGGTAIIDNVLLAAPSTPVEWIQLRLDLARSGSDTTQGMVVYGYQIKALPGTPRQRVFTIPLLLFDRESDRRGQWTGYPGRTAQRLSDFEQMAQNGDAVQFQDLAQSTSALVVIDDFEFRQEAAPGDNQQGYGGILTVQLRTIADVIAS